MTADGHDSASQAEDKSQTAFKGADDAATLRLLAEEPSVAKERVEIGRVAHVDRAHEREALVDAKSKLFRWA
jgi:hypothetical protein